MDEKKLDQLIKTVQRDIKPPYGLNEKILKGIMQNRDEDYTKSLSAIERFIFIKPLRAACALSVVVSGILWAVLGSGYPDILMSFIGKR